MMNYKISRDKGRTWNSVPWNEFWSEVQLIADSDYPNVRPVLELGGIWGAGMYSFKITKSKEEELIDLIRRAVNETGASHDPHCPTSYRNHPCNVEIWIPDDCDCWLSDAKQYLDNVYTGG